MTNKTTEADVAFIKALAELLRENELTEIEVKRDYGEDDSLNVRVSKKVEMAAPMQMHAPMAAHAPSHAPSAATAQPAAALPSQEDDPAQHPGAVVSPMVGTVYMQAEPTAPAFVKVGDKVQEGDTLLIVEAMKTMNQIHSPRSGVVKRILVEDKAAVEYGAPLMIIE